MASAPEQLVPEFYKRFIDDIFGVWIHGEEALLVFLQHANSLHPDIQFTFSYGPAVSFRDTVKIVNSSIITDLYTKATNTHQYLCPTSNHPPHVHRNLPYSLALRLRVIVSEDEVFQSRLGELKAHSLRRGCSYQSIEAQFQKVRQMPREVVLQRKKTCGSRSGSHTTCHQMGPRWPSFNRLLQQAFPILRSCEKLRHSLAFGLIQTTTIG